MVELNYKFSYLKFPSVNENRTIQKLSVLQRPSSGKKMYIKNPTLHIISMLYIQNYVNCKYKNVIFHQFFTIMDQQIDKN